MRRTSHMQRHRTLRARAGLRRTLAFTLIELMVVIAIVVISAAAMAPGIGRTLAISRANRAVLDVVRLGRRARQEAYGYGRAHVIRYLKSSTYPSGRFELWRGSTNLCRTNDWVNIIGTCSSNNDCIDAVDAATYVVGSNGVCMGCVGSGCGASCAGNVGDTNDICIEPDGDIAIRAAGTTGVFAPTDNTQSYNVLRTVSGNSVDVMRRAVFPPGGTPRAWR